MDNIVKKLLGGKKEWREMELRAAALPKDYRAVYTEMMNYMWKFTSGDGMDIVAILKDLLDLFEEGAASGKGVLEVTGPDVATFSDELLKSANTYTENWHDKLNRDVMKKLRK